MRMFSAKHQFGGLFAVLLLASIWLCEAHALGLGGLTIDSNLDQPLNGIIELYVAPGDDLTSVEAELASLQDYRNLGVDYPSYAHHIRLRRENVNGEPVLRVSSNNVVIKEPFVRLLVRINWAGGSFIREYTALIDPASYRARSPATIVAPRIVGTDQRNNRVLTNEDVEALAGEIFRPTEPANDDFAATDLSGVDAQYGPVVRGESLSVIAADLGQQYPEFSMYQIMQILFEENPNAFIDGNINGLLEGAVLRIGDLNRIRNIDVAQSREFFSRHVREWEATGFGAQDRGSEVVRVGEDQYSPPTSNDPFSTPTDSVDSFRVGGAASDGSIAGTSDSVNSDSGNAEVFVLQQQVRLLEAELSSSDLENQELSERVALLEGQLAEMRNLMNLSVADPELAVLESNLARQNNQQGSTEEETGDDSLTEDMAASVVDDFIDAQEAAAQADGFDNGDGADPLNETPDEPADNLDSSPTTDIDSNSGGNFNNTSAEVSEPASEGFLSKVMGFISGIGSNVLMLLGLLALLVLGLFMWRRRRADAEYEMSMLSIQSHSEDSESEIDTVATAATFDPKSVTVDETVENKTSDKDSSFLSVYTESDAVVQADEVDPIAEADVYIAYGRDEQAEEVLLDGITRNPHRVDIKHKLLGLYHKNENREGFERVAEELYAQKSLLTSDVWKDVSTMGREMAPNNPMFNVSVDELLVGDSGDAEPPPLSAKTTESEDDSIEQLSKDVDDAINESIELSAAIQSDSDMFAASVDEEEEATKEEDTFMLDESVDAANPSELSEIEFDDASVEISDDDLLDADDDGDDQGLDLYEEENSISLLDFDDNVSLRIDENADAVAEEESVAEPSKIDIEDDDSLFAADTDEMSVSTTAALTAEESELDISVSANIESDNVDIEPSVEEIEASELEIDLGDKGELQKTVNAGEPSVATSASSYSELTELEIDSDYDDGKTQLELAKVFVDLGDEEGARKILNEILANGESTDDLNTAATELLQSIE